ncbi:MAG: D-alanyl-D-alanine carboxypeptidase/D-alanyl-D-alanine endopeptidase [Candidatus Nanopelagicales bacterium]
MSTGRRVTAGLLVLGLLGLLGLGTPTQAAPVVAADVAEASAAVLPPELAQVLSPLPAQGIGAPLSAAKVGGRVKAKLGSGQPIAYQVVDVATGEDLAAGAAKRAAVPASTMKLVTALGVLDALGPDQRVRTSAYLTAVDADAPRLVLVGGGDPSLTTRTRTLGAAGTQARPASLQELAARTARSLLLRGIGKVRLDYNASLFTGPALEPSWSPSFPGSGVIAPVSALISDLGKYVPGGATRTYDPAGLAATRFAEELRKAGVAVSGTPRKRAEPPEEGLVAWVDSPPIGELVERMLGTSDNDFAEALGRLGALAAGQPGSFAGLAKHNRAVLKAHEVPLSGVKLYDGSGLSRRDRLTADTLTAVLVAAATGWANPAGADLSPLFSGLPVAGATGSLHARFDAAAEEKARGAVRAKTGTLTGIASLAGYASRPDGRLLAFAFLDDPAPLPIAARNKLDAAAAVLVTCKCAAPAQQDE